jgi:hypothetical protein
MPSAFSINSGIKSVSSSTLRYNVRLIALDLNDLDIVALLTMLVAVSLALVDTEAHHATMQTDSVNLRTAINVPTWAKPPST